MKRTFLVIGFSAIGGFCGAGVAWLLVVFVASFLGKGQNDMVIAISIPALAAGGTIGFPLALFFRCECSAQMGNRVFTLRGSIWAQDVAVGFMPVRPFFASPCWCHRLNGWLMQLGSRRLLMSRLDL